MKTQNKHNQETIDINPVSRKTNEEIDEDESGNLIIGGEDDAQQLNLNKKSKINKNVSSKNNLKS